MSGPGGRSVSDVPGPGAAGTVRAGTPAGRWVIVATVLGSGMAFLDSTVVNARHGHSSNDHAMRR